MTINEIYIKSFGKLSNFKLVAHEGLNIIYGENETGKSTLMAFIRSMFYGAGKGDMRRKYEPWDGGRMSGTIVFECNGKHYSLFRLFGPTKSQDKIELWCKTTGEQIALPERTEPGEYLMGINELSFMNSVYISQINPAIAGNNDEILAKLMNLASTGDETASRTEIEGRLSEAAAKLDSKRANAIIPTLEAERSAMLEKRSQIVENVKKADALRENIEKLESRQISMEHERADLSVACERMEKINKLRALEEVIDTKEAMRADEEKYEKYSQAFNSDNFALDKDFFDESRAVLEDIRDREAVLKARREQLDECKKQIDGVDRSRFVTFKAIKRNMSSVRAAIADYESLTDDQLDAERRLEEYENEASSSQMNPKNLMIIGGIISAVFFVLGFFHWVFFIICAFVIAGFAAFFILKKKGIIAEPSSGIELEIQEIERRIRDLNKSNRVLLDDVGVPSVQLLREEFGEMERVGEITKNLLDKKERLKADISELEQSTEEKKEKLKEALEHYTKVDSGDKAVSMVSSLDKMQREFAALEAKRESAQSGFEKLLDGREFDDIRLEAEMLREELGEITEDSNELDELVQRSDDLTKKLNEVKTELAVKQTELAGCGTNIQDVEQFNDKVKLLNAQIERYRFEYDSINIAISALGEAFETMQRDFGPIINFKAGRILNELTDGKYSSVFISEKLVPSVTDGPNSSNIRNCSSLSLGTNDQVYLALRLALAEIVSDVSLPVFLDDAFAQYDDKRTQSALFYLAKQGGGKDIGQVIIFTCHKSIVKMAKDIGIQNPIIKISEQ